MRDYYLFGMGEAVRNASRLGLQEISVIEFGVAGGAGLLSMEEIADKLESEHNVKIQIYGFDSGAGLPSPLDYRDLPYTWRPGFFAMDRDALQRRLRRATLVIGDVADTAKTFFQTYRPAPIGFVAFDLDFYSSTKAAFEIFEWPPFDAFLPRIYCYVDDTVGDLDEVHCEFVGALLAIKEFNAGHADRKIAQINGLRYKLDGANVRWHEQIYVCHMFSHSLYAKYIRTAGDWQMPIAPEMPEIGQKIAPHEIPFTRLTWRFWRSNGSVITEKMQLLPNGSIGGYNHRNEATWRLQPDCLLFLDADGRATSRFENFFLDSSTGKRVARGRFLLGSVNFHLMLSET